MKIDTATNPKWVNAEKTLIDCEIQHPIFGTIPFTASPEDVEEHGREIFARAAAGEFGAVADFVPSEQATQQTTTEGSV